MDKHWPGVSRIGSLWQRLSGSLWFLPAVIVAFSLGLAVLLVDVSNYVDDEMLQRYPRIFGANAESSRSMLSTIAGSMVTVAGVTFSILVVAVSQASTQYTPRVMRNFMRDRLSQVTLGVLIGVFAYCLIVLRTVRSGDTPFIPSLAVITAIALALFAVSLLMYFIHHIASTLEVGAILSSVAKDTVHAIHRLFPEKLAESGEQATPHDRATAKDAHWQMILADHSGFIQYMNGNDLLSLAAKHDVVIRMDRAVGEFVAQGTPLASFTGGSVDTEKLAHALNELYILDSYRTIHQDASFGIRQIVDIALKALSPSTNDSTTAVTCINYLVAILVEMANREVPSHDRYLDGKLRVIAQGSTFETLLDEAFDEIGRQAHDNLRVLQRAAGALEVIAAATRTPSRLHAVRRQASAYEAAIRRLLNNDDSETHVSTGTRS